MGVVETLEVYLMVIMKGLDHIQQNAGLYMTMVVEAIQ
jgi:hypothetical protein